MKKLPIKDLLRDETGSLSILVFALFFVLLVSSLGVVDISDNFLAKRQLIEIGEVAITQAAHQLSLSRYYSGNVLMDSSGADGTQFRIPLDQRCAGRIGANSCHIKTKRIISGLFDRRAKPA